MNDMLSYKNNQTAPPLYDYYVETDLDDQPVDYSKKYSDQESYEDRRRTKSNQPNPNQFPASEASQSIKPPTCRNSNDEVKIYCIEDTPITISSASSFSDLREMGTANSMQKAGLKRSFTSTNDDDISQDSFEVKKSVESYEVKNDEPVSKEKDETMKEVKSVSFRDGEDISKASSPLMFSRSSSVCSLNSFEQHSIVDDRSSVSAFSALTSGIISPSDLPDSPGEVMSPVLTDKTNSPKMGGSKADSDNEFENMELCEKEKDISNDIFEMKNNNSPAAQLQLPESTDYMAMPSNKSGRNSDMDENDILSQQMEFLHDSSAEMDEVFINSEYERNSFVPKNERDVSDQLSVKSEEESDGDDDILLQQCIELGMPNKPPDNKCDINVLKKVEYPLHTQNPSDLQVQAKGTNVLNDKLVTSENTNYIQQPTTIKLLEEQPVKTSAKLVHDCTLPSQHGNHPISCQVELKSDPVKSDSDSDDDMLLQRCIELGMPKMPCDKMTHEEKFLKTVYSSQCVSHNSRSDVLQKTPVKFDDDDSDGDDILQQCINLGMPKESVNKVEANVYKNRQCHAVSPKPTHSQVPAKKEVAKSTESSLHGHNLLAQCCMQYGVPHEMPGKMGVNSERVNGAKYSSPSKQSRVENNVKTPFPSKSEADSDEDDMILQQCIQLGMPKKSPEKRGMHSRILNKAEFTSHSASVCSPKDLRDGCPDGISDGDEEDDILAQCIRAGMPRPNTVNDVQDRLHNSRTGNIPRKLLTPNQSFSPNTSTESSKKFGPRLPPNLPYAPVHSGTTWISNTSFIDVDSMRIYRTEDTPILSPSASISDLSSLSFNESFLNNSRNSDCSSESDDDEMLLQCIRSGMPEAKKGVA